ncbi:MAG: hypothetical protein CVU56_23250 [Deltaproteobacteria bacterium HGW-Deltaproteobacteria-14]|nr:MAG: hypothetical protein CVU56_23250 [Deltaproteobacteria bacterium HGW-Deltaproteobacteria-14]
MPTLLDRVGRLNLKRLGARTAIVEAGGERMHVYRLSGAGERPLVLLHGVGSSAAPFAPLVARLRPHFGAIFMPEAPGHGFSPPPAAPLDTERFFGCVRACLDAEVPAPFALYGNSLGGGVALRYAIARPERVSTLAVLSPAGARVDAEALAALVAGFELPTRKDARAFVRRLFHRPPWYARFAAGTLRRRLGEPAVRALLAAARVEDQLDPTALVALPMPVLFMWGGAERVLPPEHLAWFRAHLPPHARVVSPPHFGHSAYLEYPDEVAAEVVAFAAGLPSPADAGRGGDGDSAAAVV